MKKGTKHTDEAKKKISRAKKVEKEVVEEVIEFDPSDLKFVMIYDFSLIPRHLLEQIKDNDNPNLNIDLLCKYGNQMFGGGFTFLEVLVDSDNIIRAFVWFTVSPVFNAIQVDMVSLEKKYQGTGKLSPIIINRMKDLMIKYKLSKIVFATKTPEIFEKHGVERSNSIIMEITK